MDDLNELTINEKLLSLVEGKETPDSWQNW